MNYPEDFIKSEHLNLWLPQESQENFAYSDGQPLEEYIESCLLKTSDLSSCSPELASHIKDWSSEYHFSPRRSNLLRPLQLKSTHSVLELGAGCGAITRYLGETVGEVVAIEGSPMRAKLAALRCRDINNVTVINSNFQNINISQKFDIVTLIGVLEYSGKYINSEQPYLETLKIAQNYLKEDGILVIAIENKLGLKYFAGCSEDHTGELFDSLEGYPSGSKVRTFGQQELEQLLKATGFRRPLFLSVFPDYKLPEVVLRAKDNLPQANPYLYNWLGYANSRDYINNATNLFQEFLAAKQLEANGILSQFANSFLVIASSNQNLQDEYLEPNRLTWKYNVMRAPAFMTQVGLYQNSENNSLQVKRQPLYPEASAAFNNTSTNLKHYPLEEAPFIEGTNLMEQLLLSIKVKNDGDNQAFQSCLKIWYDFLFMEASLGDDNELYLPGSYIDCVPWNLIISKEGVIEYIDKEWVYLEKLPLKYILFRGLSLTYFIFFTWLELKFVETFKELSFEYFFQYCLGLISITTDVTEFNNLINLEWQFQNKLGVIGLTSLDHLKQNIYSIPQASTFATQAKLIERLSKEIHQTNIELHNTNIEAKARIEAMKSSKFWQLRNSWFRFKKSLGLPIDAED